MEIITMDVIKVIYKNNDCLHRKLLNRIVMKKKK